MNAALEALALEIGLAAPAHEHMRLVFGHACALRIEHLLEEAGVSACLDKLGWYLRGELGAVALKQVQQDAAGFANRHPGSKSIDGCGHAAVSASYAVAHAVNGRALQARVTPPTRRSTPAAATRRLPSETPSSRSFPGRWRP